MTPDQARLGALIRFSIAITILNLLGHTVLGFEISVMQMLVCVATGYLIEIVLESVAAWSENRKPVFLGGGFGHFYHYAPVKIEYAIDRYAMEAKRLFDVANRRLAESRFLGGDEYTIADIATFTWLGNIYRGEAYGDAATFLSMHEYEHVGRWVDEIGQRPGVVRGRVVNSVNRMPERHSAADFDALTPNG